MSALLEIKDLYGGYQEGVNILQGINLTVAEGEAVGIIGLNGSGKSTLGKAIMNQIPFRQGDIIFNGLLVNEKSSPELAQMGISVMHQSGVVFPNLSVWQNIRLACGNKPDKNYYEQLEDIIPLLRQSKKVLSQTMADKLSGGQRHELALAMALARKPRLVILDEPSAGLSPKAVEIMYGMLHNISNLLGMSTVLIEQNISRALSYCDRCILLGQGVILHEFKGDSLLISEVEKVLFNN